MRVFAVPTLWRPDILQQFQDLNDRHQGTAKIVEVYGSHAANCFGSGRASVVLPRIGDPQLEDHVGRARRFGFSFNYLLNAACLGGLEGTYEGQRHLRQFLDFLVNAGVDRVTVTSPMLIELVKAFQPDLHISASVIAYIDQVEKLRLYESLGVQRVSLDIDVTRNFPLLRALRRASCLELGLIVNSLCRLGCPFKTYHYNMNAHFSQTSRFLNKSGQAVVAATVLDYVGARCMLQNHADKVDLMKTAWVRPEDLAHYTAVGINIFKIQGRGAKPENLLRTITMYMAGGLPARFVPISLFASGRSGFTLDNQALEGFLDFFVNHPYRCHLGCEDCNHCYDWAERAVIVDEDAVQQVMAAAETLRKDSLTFHRRVDEFGEILIAGPLADFFSQPA